MTEREPFKELFNRAAVERLATRLATHAPGFERERFVAEVVADLPSLELLQRVDRITQALHDHLPGEYPAALQILLSSLGPDDGTIGITGTDGFQFLPLIHYVGVYGLEDYERSMAALYEMTKRFSAENDIRPFVRRYPEATLERLLEWTGDPDPRVRRLCSEGIRPRLPWTGQLKEFMHDPRPVFLVLERLKDDPDEWVRRSVANNLNDIAKDHPNRVLETLRRWNPDAREELKWVIRHALRTLVKQGHPEALELLGFSLDAGLAVHRFELVRPEVPFGEALEFHFELESTSSRPLTLSIDYAIHHQKANGTLAPKVFKLTRRTLRTGESCRIERAHPIRAITTRRYYPGLHRIELLINGQSFGLVDFTLNM